MKYSEFNFDNNKIEFLNSIFGKETIRLNGKKVSERYSITGTKHDFKIGKEDYRIMSTYKLFRDGALKLDLIKDKITIYSTSSSVNSRHRIIWMAMGIVIVFVIARLFV